MLSMKYFSKIGKDRNAFTFLLKFMLWSNLCFVKLFVNF